jgi:hypothetical protein
MLLQLVHTFSGKYNRFTVEIQVAIHVSPKSEAELVALEA